MSKKDKRNFGTVLTFAAVLASGGTLGPWAAANYAYFWGAAIAYGAYSARAQRKEAKASQEAALQDRRIMLKGGTHSKGYVYGYAFAPTVITFHREAKGPSDPYLWLLLTLPIAHQIHGFEQIYFGDTPLLPLAANADVAPGPFTRQYTRRHMHQGSVPTDGIVQLPLMAEDVNETDAWLLVPLEGYDINIAIRRQQPPIITGDDTFQDIQDPATVSVQVVGPVQNRTIQIIGAPAGAHFTVTYSYRFNRSFIKCWVGNGEPNGTIFNNLIAATANEAGDMRWTASDKLKNIPWILLRLHVDEDVFPREIEPVTALVRGMPNVLDTRNGSQGWYANSMLVARDYAIRECGIIPQEINIPRFNGEVNACDEAVPGPDQFGNVVNVRRYDCHGFLDTAATPLDNLNTILSSCDGAASYVAGQFNLSCGRWIEPTIHLKDEDLVSMPSFVLNPDRGELFNSVRANFVNSQKPKWPNDLTRAYRSPLYIQQDAGRERMEEINLPMTAQIVSAERIAKQMLHRHRNALTVTATFFIKAMGLAPESTVWLTLRSYGMDTKGFRVKKIRPVAPWEYELTLQEDAPALYMHNYDEMSWPDPTPNTSLPDPRVVQEITGLNAITNESVAAWGPDGELTPQCKAYWNAVTDKLVLATGYIEFRHRRIQDDDFTYSPKLPPVAKDYRFPIRRGDVVEMQVRAANSLVRGPWSKPFTKEADDAPTRYLQGNWLRNAELKDDDDTYPPIGGYRVLPGWTQTVLSGPAVITGPTYHTNWVVSNADSIHSGYILSRVQPEGYGRFKIESSSIIVTPGERIVAFAHVLVGNGRYAMGLRFYGADGTTWVQYNSSGYRTNTAPPLVNPGPEHMQKVGFFANVPATAKYVRLEFDVDKGGQAVQNQQTNFYMGRPYVGRASKGQIDFPPWQSGTGY